MTASNQPIYEDRKGIECRYGWLWGRMWDLESTMSLKHPQVSDTKGGNAVNHPKPRANK